MVAVRSRVFTICVGFVLAVAGSFSPVGVTSSLAVDPITGLYFDGPGFPANTVAVNLGPDSTWDASIGVDPSILTVTVDSYAFTFASPPGTTISTGTYTDAVRAAFRGAGEPGVEVVAGHTGCSTLTGAFTVLELTLDGTDVTAAAVDFEMHCESQSPAIYGSLRYLSSEGYRGIAIDPFPYPGELFLGYSLVGEPATRAITVTATGTDPLTISGVATTGNAFDIAEEDCTGSLVAGSSCTVVAQVTPSGLGAEIGTLSIDDDALPGGHTFGVYGWGLAASLTPASLDFGAVDLGTGVTQTVTLENGPDPLSGLSAEFAGYDYQFWISSKTCGSTLAAGASCTYSIRYLPDIAGAVSDTLVVHSNELGQLSVEISGFGDIGTDIAWGNGQNVGQYTWNAGASLAWSQPAATAWLHTTATSALAGSKVVKDSGPYAPIYYRRSSNSGRTWDAKFRVNPTSQHGDRSTIAAAGSNVYVGWVRVRKFVDYRPSAPRALYVRANTGSGGSAKWKPVRRLTSLSGQVGYPVIAADGTSVYLVWTNAATGAIRIAISNDRGGTWQLSTLGSTTLSSADGFDGFPYVGASGSRVTVSWTANGNGAVKTRTSVTGGQGWAAADTLTSSSNGLSSVAVLDARSSVGWSTGRTVHVQTLTGDGWGPDRTLVPPGEATWFNRSWYPVVALQGSTDIAVAFSSCIAPCPATKKRRTDLIWAESTDGGASWASQVVGYDNEIGSQRYLPSVVWPTPTLRYLMWNYYPGDNGWILFVRRGSGSP